MIHNKLRNRWSGQQTRIENIVKSIIAGDDWTCHLEKLPFIDEIDRLPGDCFPRDLRGISLSDIDIINTSRLADTNFDYSIIRDIDFSSSNFNGASFNNSKIIHVNFNNSQLNNTEFISTAIIDVRFTNSRLTNINFTDSKLSQIYFTNSVIRNIIFSRESTFGFLRKLIGRNNATYIRGIEHDIDKIKYCDTLSYNYLKEEQVISAISRNNKIFSVFFYLFTDYGRNFTRLISWIFFIWIVFAFLFASYPIPDFITNTTIRNVLDTLSPEIKWNSETHAPFYFSCITLTTLGYGDITPVDSIARFYCATESILGYVFLGMFISMIFHILSKE